MGALMKSSTNGQLLLPMMNKAISEVAAVDGIFSDYVKQLKMMSQEIQQLATINNEMDTQSRNQRELLAELDKILERLALPDEALVLLEKAPLDNPEILPEIQKAAGMLYVILGAKMEKGIREIRGVAERLAFVEGAALKFEARFVAGIKAILLGGSQPTRLNRKGRLERMKLVQLDLVDQMLLPFAPMIAFMAEHSPQCFLDVKLVSTYIPVHTIVILFVVL